MTGKNVSYIYLLNREPPGEVSAFLAILNSELPPFRWKRAQTAKTTLTTFWHSLYQGLM